MVLLFSILVNLASLGNFISLGLRVPVKIRDIGPYFPNPLINQTNKTKCLGPLGCFKIEPPFYDMYQRQITFLPFDREKLDVKFFLFTVNSKEEIWAEKIDELKSSNFNPKIKTKIIVHGFIDKIRFSHWIDMKDAFLRKGDCNVIMVDWGRANGAPYEQAVSNTRAVGAEIALLVNSITNNTIANAKDFHLIGHSLGAHICGYAGERITDLGRITGLDPAGPYFAETPKEVSLDKTDANFVDVILTNSAETILTGLGINHPIGHVNLNANNGIKQPGCEGKLDFFCDHNRANKLFTDTINNQACKMVALKCHNYYSYEKGRCGYCGEKSDKCLVVGLEAEDYWDKSNTTQVYYFKTGSTKPYCQFQYRVVINTAKESGWLTKGRATVVIEGSNANFESKLGRDSQLFAPFKKYTYLLSSQNDLGPVKSVIFSWEGNHYETLAINETTTTGEAAIYIDNLTISPILINHGEIKLCRDIKGPIGVAVNVTFNPCNKD